MGFFVHVHVHVHVKLPSRQDAQPKVPWRHNEEGAGGGAHAHGLTRATHNHRHRIGQTRRKGRECQGGEGKGPQGGSLFAFTNLARATVLKVGHFAYAPVPHRKAVAKAPLQGDWARQVPCAAFHAERAPPPGQPAGNLLPIPVWHPGRHRTGCAAVCRDERAAGLLTHDQAVAAAPGVGGVPGPAYEERGLRAAVHLGEIRPEHTRRRGRESTVYTHMPTCPQPGC